MVARQDSPMGSGPSDSGSRDPERGGRPATRRPERGRAARFLAFRHPRWTAVLGWFSRRSARSSPSLGPPPRCSGRDLPPHDRPRLPVGGEEPRLARSTGRLARLRSRPWSTLTTQLTNLTPAPLPPPPKDSPHWTHVMAPRPPSTVTEIRSGYRRDWGNAESIISPAIPSSWRRRRLLHA
jgi:hypothetical protein